MVTTLDNNGKISIPKELLALLGITAGTPLTVFEKEKKIIIEPLATESSLVEKDGMLVYTGKLNGSYELLINERQYRDEQLLSGGKS